MDVVRSEHRQPHSYFLFLRVGGCPCQCNACASPWGRFFFKLIFMVVSLIVPEGAIICAFGQ